MPAWNPRLTDVKNSSLLLAIGIKLAIVGIAYMLSINILSLLGVTSLDHAVLINYAPEVWLTLLALVFGTLIIVVSIASENTPKLIDLFIGDPRGRLYIWLIMLSSLENIYLQIFSSNSTIFFSNLIFLNSYVLLPCFVLLAIPYTFYILRYTKNANVIERIYRENVQALLASNQSHPAEIHRSHLTLFETINQLHDLLQYIQFKEPKGDIIIRMGKSVRLYLKLKKTYPDEFFRLDEPVKNDISFRTLGEKYKQIELERTFYEQKVLKVFGTTYLLLMKESHYELASLCGNELVETAKVATRLNDQPVVNMVIVHFNTFLRYGINQGLKTREIRNVYNTIYHYSQLVHLFMDRREDNRILQCCQYLVLYAKEGARLSLSEPLFVFMIEAISWELKKFLVLLHRNDFPRDLQRVILNGMTGLRPPERRRTHWQRNDHNGVRLIQIALCLYYVSQGEDEFNEIIVESIIADLKEMDSEEVRDIIERDCLTLHDETEEFWEETDQGNRNIFFTSDKSQITNFLLYVTTKMDSSSMMHKP